MGNLLFVEGIDLHIILALFIITLLPIFLHFLNLCFPPQVTSFLQTFPLYVLKQVVVEILQIPYTFLYMFFIAPAMLQTLINILKVFFSGFAILSFLAEFLYEQVT